MKFYIVQALFLALFSTAIESAAQTNILPTPRCTQHNEESSFFIDEGMSIGIDSPSLLPAAQYLGGKLQLENIVMGGGQIMLHIDESLPQEGYRLLVGSYGIHLYGGGYGGVINGIMTLLQRLNKSPYKNFMLPCRVEGGEIEDAPAFAYRGFMLDVCRTWLPKKDIMELIELLAYHKINTLRLHLTDDEAWRIEIKSHPELAEIGGFRGGDSPIWPRYGKWNQRWGGYYTQEDMREIIEYASVRNITIIPEIDLPGHSLCIATIHPEILCRYTPNTSAAFGYDVRSAFCPTKEENYALLEDILDEICALFPSKYIHIGGDEVDKSQWRRCPDCKAWLNQRGLTDASHLQTHFMSRLENILIQNGKSMGVWNDAVKDSSFGSDTQVYGWESVKECRRVAGLGYKTVVMPGEYFYFDMKQSTHEPGHDWAAIFDWTKVHNFSFSKLGFTPEEMKCVVGVEASFFSEAYTSRNPENNEYLHYQLFPRMLAFAEIAWCGEARDSNADFLKRLKDYYSLLDDMDVAYRLEKLDITYADGLLSVCSPIPSDIVVYNTTNGETYKYSEPILTHTPEHYYFVAHRGRAKSPICSVSGYFRTINPSFVITSSMNDSERYSFVKAQQYGRLARTTRAADVGDWVMFTFDKAVECRAMKVATGNFQLPRYLFENGYVEISYDGQEFERIGELECGMYTITLPKRAIKAVRMVCTSRGNGAEWVSIQPPTIWPII